MNKRLNQTHIGTAPRTTLAYAIDVMIIAPCDSWRMRTASCPRATVSSVLLLHEHDQRGRPSGTSIMKSKSMKRGKVQLDR